MIRPQDRAAVFSVSTDVVVLQEFTKVQLLVDATRQLKRGRDSLYDGIYLASDYLKPAEGRRVIVIVSDGSDTTSGKGLLEALAQAQKSDSVIFAIFTGSPWPSKPARSGRRTRSRIVDQRDRRRVVQTQAPGREAAWR